MGDTIVLQPGQKIDVVPGGVPSSAMEGSDLSGVRGNGYTKAQRMHLEAITATAVTASKVLNGHWTSQAFRLMPQGMRRLNVIKVGAPIGAQPLVQSAKLLKFAKVAPVVCSVADGIEAATHEKDVGHGIATGVATTGLSLAGAYGGAALGAAIGSVIPVGGTAVGAVLGFGIGLAGALIGSEVGRRWGGQALYAVGKGVGDVCNTIGALVST